MPGLLASLRRPLPSLLTFAAVLSLTFWLGCGGNSKNPVKPGGGATTSSFTGWFGNGTESGLLRLTVSMGNLAGRLHAHDAASTTVTATGFLTVSGGATDTLNGNFDNDTGYLNVTGGGYSLGGVYDPGPPRLMFGTYSGPNGDGDFTCEVGAAASADVYCGTYLNQAQTSNGTFIFAIRGSALEGAAIEEGGAGPDGFTGTISGTGTVRTLNVSSLITNGYKLTATGQLDTGTHSTSGTYKIDYNSAPYDSGAWAGQRCNP